MGHPGFVHSCTTPQNLITARSLKQIKNRIRAWKLLLDLQAVSLACLHAPPPPHTHTGKTLSLVCTIQSKVLTPHKLEILKYCVSDNMQRIISHSNKDTALYHTDTNNRNKTQLYTCVFCNPCSH
jgi:hypothetical protein